MELSLLKSDDIDDLKLLRTKCKNLTEEEITNSVVKIGDEKFSLEEITDGILDVMYKNCGIGLTSAHTRTLGKKENIQKRIVVIDLKATWDKNGELIKKGGKPIIMINPEIVETSSEKFTLEGGEGSLSIPGGKKFLIERFTSIKVSYYDLEGKKQEMEADYQKNKLLTVCIQHEIDQVDGILISDIGKPV